MRVVANIDGASFGNPGQSGLGVVIRDAEGNLLQEYCENIGVGTNNRAEYMALLKCVELAKELGADELDVRSDSLLVVSQVNGLYKIKNPDIKIFIRDLHDRLTKFKMKFRIQHIPREMNRAADKLSKKGAGLAKE